MAVPDPKAWASANAGDLRYFGCRICDLGDELRNAVNYLWDSGFRRTSIDKYLREAGQSLDGLSDTQYRKHFAGGADHGRP